MDILLDCLWSEIKPARRMIIKFGFSSLPHHLSTTFPVSKCLYTRGQSFCTATHILFIARETCLGPRCRPNNRNLVRLKKVVSVWILVNNSSACCWCENSFWASYRKLMEAIVNPLKQQRNNKELEKEVKRDRGRTKGEEEGWHMSRQDIMHFVNFKHFEATVFVVW